MRRWALGITAALLAAGFALWLTLGHGWVYPLVWLSGADAVPDPASDDCLHDALHIDSVPFVNVDPYEWCDER